MFITNFRIFEPTVADANQTQPQIADANQTQPQIADAKQTQPQIDVRSESQFMANERIVKNYPSQATRIFHTPKWKSRKWLAISSQIPINSFLKSQFSNFKFFNSQIATSFSLSLAIPSAFVIKNFYMICEGGKLQVNSNNNALSKVEITAEGV